VHQGHVSWIKSGRFTLDRPLSYLRLAITGPPGAIAATTIGRLPQNLERALALLVAQRRSKLLQHRSSFQVDQRQGDLVVTSGDFCAVYFKPSDEPQLILRRRTQTGDHELLALAWQAANDKARELGWIVQERQGSRLPGET
jgi:hypothetical protein